MSIDFDRYLERYCTKHKIDPEEAKKHKLVQDTKEYYYEREVTRNENTEIYSE